MDKGSEFKEKIHMNPKLVLFQGVSSLINSRIGREVKNYELKTIAFVVDELHQGLETMTADQFLEEKLGVKKEDNRRDVSWHIYEAIYNAKKLRLSREKALSMSDPAKISSLRAIEGLIESNHNSTLQEYQNKDSKSDIPIGGVMDEWVPQWFPKFQTR